MDIFISYRRDTGSDKADLIREKLSKRGIECFLDKHYIRNEDFLNKIKHDIDMAPNFLMVLTPGYFVRKEETEDYVREEFLYAKSQNKNIIGISFPPYDHGEVDWDNDPEIAEFKRFNYSEYNNSNDEVEKGCINQIIKLMRDEKGQHFSTKKKIISNSWYAEHEMSDDDMLWIISDHDVCKRMDWRVLDHALQETVFAGKDKLNLFVYKAYDIDTYQKKYELEPGREHLKKIDQVYGVTYDSMLEHANDSFGEDHFISDDFSAEDYPERMRELLERHHLPGFDIIDLTLVIKDYAHPEKRVRELANFLNPEGGIIYIRELDDDYIDAYPDEKGLIKKMREYLELDDGAGNRHTGKKIFTFLKKAGARNVYISDEVISTANRGAQYRQRLCDTYFSYLLPEMKALADPENKTHKYYDKFEAAYEWLQENYEEVESLICSSELYFRAGYVAGYGVFKKEEDY